MGRSFAILAALIAGCTTMNHERVEGWPALQVVEHYVSHNDMRARCSRYVGFGMVPVACAEFDLAGGRCHIWYSSELPPSRFIVDHERLHCAGDDHVGSVSMQQILKRYLASREASATAGSSR
jgi:hypothetical protein